MNDIRLGYALSATWNRGAIDLDAADEAVLRYRCFLGDVVLEVGDLDASARWGWVPILDFALGLSAISNRLLASDRDQVFEFTESDASISFHRLNDMVVIDPSYAPGTADVRLDDLSTSTTKLVATVLQDLVERYPEVARNAFVGSLLESGLADGETSP